MFERFTERARQVIILAQDIVRQYDNEAIGVDHILLALAAEEEGLAARVLTLLDFDAEKAGAAVLKAHEGEHHKQGVQTAFTPRAKHALELALREALGLGHNYIGTEHILLGVVREASNVEGLGHRPGLAHLILREQDITLEDVRDKVIAMLSGPARNATPKDMPKIPEYLAFNPDGVSELEDDPVGRGQLMEAVLGQLARAATGSTKVSVDDAARVSRINARRQPLLRPNPTFTVQDLQDIGDVALSSIDIVGLSDEYRDGYRQLADSISNLLNLVERDTRATA